MSDELETTPEKRNPWVRGLFMLLILMAIHVSGTLLFLVTLVQFVLMLLGDTPNERLVAFGRSLGSYLKQCTHYLTFASEQKPFPFSEWPSGNED
jgi:hypothetical protein